MISANNIAALNCLRNFKTNDTLLTRSLARLSTGLRINGASDDAAGLAISTRMRVQIRSLRQAYRNTQDGISMIQTAEGGLREVNNMLQRLRELTLQAASDSLTSNDRSEIQKEFSHILSQIDSIASQTEFNTMRLLDGTSSVLASSSNDLLQLIVNGSTLSWDQFGSLQALEGRYRLDVQTNPGQAQIKNSHIFNLINGTMGRDINLTPEKNEYSGLESLSAQGLAVGDYRIETRASPFGNIYYLDRFGAETANPGLDIGVNSVVTTPSPQILPFGEYHINAAGQVPFMATFADFADPSLEGFADDIIRGVNPTTRNNIDVSMDILAFQGASNAETEVAWRNIGGANAGTVLVDQGISGIHPDGNLSFETKDDYHINMYSRFNIINEWERDFLATDIDAVTYYRSVTDSELELELTYKTGETSSTGITATYQAAGGQNIALKTSYILQGTVDITMDDGATTIPSIDISGMDIEETFNLLVTETDGLGLTFALESNFDNTEKRIVVTNNSGDVVGIAGVGAEQLGINNNNILHLESEAGTYLEHEKEHSFSVAEQTVTEVASTLDSGLNPYSIAVTAFDNADGTRHLTINNTGNYRLEIEQNLDFASIQAELGLNAFGVQGPGVNWQDGTKVFHDHTFSLDIGELTVSELTDALETGVGAQSINGATIENFTGATGAGTLRNVTFTNNSIYRLSFSDEGGTQTGVELGLNTTMNRGGVLESNSVYHGYVRQFDMGYRRLDEIVLELNSELQSALLSDELNNDTAIPFVLEDHGDGTQSIRINNSAANPTYYDITISDATHSTAFELGLAGTVQRDDTMLGTARDFGSTLGTIAAGRNIEELYTDINDLTGWISAAWLQEPDYVGNRTGQFIITNEDISDNRREVVFLSSDGTNQLLAPGDVTVEHAHAGAVGNIFETKEWLARDRVQVQYTYRGISNNGTEVSGSRSDIWWRGEQGDTNPLVTFAYVPFESVYIPERVNGAGPTIGDNWMLYTRASATNNHTILDFHLRDGATNANYRWNSGGYGGGSYAFNQGVLDNTSISIPQFVYTGHFFHHNIDFGIIASRNEAAVYNQRYSTADYNHYSHVYYGDQATYYFAGGGDWSDYLLDISVWQQNEINASLLFTSQGGNNFQVEGKGYDRQGNEWSLYPPVDINIGSGPVDIGGIHFDRFNLGGGITAGDKFVVNVAARAGEGRHDLPPNYSDANIRISGNPWFSGGTGMEYRFAEDAVNGRELELLGYFVDPLLGYDDDIGVWTGSLLMDVAGGGFRTDNTVHHGQNVIMEINYMGTTEPIASSLLTGYHFQDLRKGESYRDLLDAIEYNPNETKNAAMLLEVVEARGSNLVVRAQAHIYEKDGTYHYAFDDYITLGKNNTDITFFGECGPGLNFSHFDFEDIHRFKTGDRFSLSLAANGEPSGSTDDEIYLWSSAYGRDIYPHTWRFDNNVLDNTITTLRTYQVDYYNGKVFDSEINLKFNDFHGGTDTGVIGTGGPPRVIRDTARFYSEYRASHDIGTAHRYSRLRDIEQFWTPEGRFLLEEPTEITIWHKGNQVSVMLYGNDEIMNVLDRINGAIYEQLGQGEIVEEGDRYKFASFVNTTSQQNTLETMEGSIIIRSALAGKDGELLFQGDENMLKALGLSVIQTGEENIVQYNLYNRDKNNALHANGLIESGSGAFGVIHENIGLKMDSQLGIEQVVYNKCAENFESLIAEAESIYVRLVDNSRVLQIGPNTGQIAWLNLGDISSANLGLDGLTVLNRDEANHAVKQIDQAMGRVSAMRSSLGGLQNRLEHTLQSLMISKENLTNAESRIRDADMAQEIMDYSIRQIIMQTTGQLLSAIKIQSQLILELVNSL